MLGVGALLLPVLTQHYSHCFTSFEELNLLLQCYCVWTMEFKVRLLVLRSITIGLMGLHGPLKEVFNDCIIGLYQNRLVFTVALGCLHHSACVVMGKL